MKVILNVLKDVLSDKINDEHLKVIKRIGINECPYTPLDGDVIWHFKGLIKTW